MLIGFFMLMIDSTIVSVANPSIQAGLRTSLTSTIWVTSAYLLGIAVPLLVSGRLGDRFGQKNVFMLGMLVFTAASLGCGLAPSIGVLIIARTVQGVGGALMTPQTQAVIVRIFPRERRGAPMGLWGSVSGVALLVGPLLGGFLVDSIGWQAIFLINVPIGIAGLILAAIFVPVLPTSRPRFDIAGVALSGAGMFLLVFGLQEGTGHNWGRVWGPLTIWELIGAGVALLAVFVLSQVRIGQPLIPMRLFRERDFALASGAVSAMGFTVTSMSLPLLYFLQLVRGFEPTTSAVFMMPSAVLGGVLAPWVGSRLVPRLGAHRVASTGLVIVAGSIAWYTSYLTPSSHIWLALLPSATLGIGNSCVWSPLSLSATHHLPPRDAGAGAGVYNVTRQIGTVLGSACISTLMNARLLAHGIDASGRAAQQAAAAGLPAAIRPGFAQSMSQAMWLPVAVALAGAVVAAFLTGHGGRQAAA